MKEVFVARNIPNFLSAYRILVLPLVFWFILESDKLGFVFLLCLNVLIDILDGGLARRFGWQSALGARLDSIADGGTYFAAVTGFLVFEPAFVFTHIAEFSTFLALYCLPQAISLVRFGSINSFHLYSGKWTGYLQGVFFLSYFTLGYSPYLFYFTLCFSCLSFIESSVIALRIPSLRSDVKGIYWMWKEHKAIR